MYMNIIGHPSNLLRPCLTGVLVAVCTLVACDSKDAAKEEASAAEANGEDEAEGSELAQKAQKEAADIKARLEKGEDVKYACAGNLAQYADLEKATDAGEEKAWEALSTVCYVEVPKKMIADLRAKIESGELGTMDTVDLQTFIGSDGFPTDGEPAKLAAEAKKVLEVEIPTHQLSQHLETAKQEKEEGKSVSMGCIKAKQVVEKSRASLEGDEKGKTVLEAYTVACPEK